MNNDKKNLDELFQYGSRILSRLKTASEEKSAELHAVKDNAEKTSDELNNLRDRHENLRQRLKEILST